jgi:GTP-sensing pleiotropic transcriptional regulator CodY
MISKSYNVIKLQGKFSKRVTKLPQGLTVVEFKALRDITKGVISSSTLIIRQIASSLHKKIRLDKECERLYRNLKNDKLSDVISENIIVQ